MTLHTLQCPNCAAPLPPAAATTVVVCEFCERHVRPEGSSPRPDARDSGWTDELVLDVCAQKLSTLKGMHVYPNIPSEMIETVKDLYTRRLSDVTVLALYDDTWLSAGQEGFVITRNHLLWNYGEGEPKAMSWDDLNPEWFTTKAERVVFQGHSLHLSQREAPPIVAACLQALSRMKAP